jgi:putative hemolysin
VASVIRRLGLRPSLDLKEQEEEIKALLREGLQAGVIEESEQQIVERVFRLGDHRASDLMTPMTEVVWLDVADSADEMKRKISESPHSRFPVCEGSIDGILGIIQSKDLLVQSFRGQPFGIAGLLKMPLLFYERTPGLKVLEMFKSSDMHFAIVLDEFGSVRGVLTLNDILEALVGDMPDGEEPPPRRFVKRDDGSWLLDGRLSLAEFKDLLAINDLPEGDYQTLAGLVISQVGHIPSPGDRFEWHGYGFEVVEMDSHRVEKVLLAPRAEG